MATVQLLERVSSKHSKDFDQASAAMSNGMVSLVMERWVTRRWFPITTTLGKDNSTANELSLALCTAISQTRDFTLEHLFADAPFGCLPRVQICSEACFHQVSDLLRSMDAIPTLAPFLCR
jgi:hypothetical protein